MAESKIPVRLILCVDGTWCTPDGTSPGGNGNQTNIYRLAASIFQGECEDLLTGKTYFQKVSYHHGIASGNDLSITTRITEGITGSQSHEFIKNAYRECCELSGPEDEVWLYGFSRGAFIVRAVAGLLHYAGALKSADNAGEQFEKEYKSILSVYKNRKNGTALGEAHFQLGNRARDPPRIQFVGAFDTVKAVQDNIDFDIQFNNSITHWRHALALNEKRSGFLPEIEHPDFAAHKSPRSLEQSFVQAWFVGSHGDIGGSNNQDGLSLYPLQWMLIESRNVGLCLGFKTVRDVNIHNPLLITGLQTSDETEPIIIPILSRNDIITEMVDIKSVHMPSEHQGRYTININQTKTPFNSTRHRQPFADNGHLEGWNPNDPMGTIIHPSVYMIMDTSDKGLVSLHASPFYKHLEPWRRYSIGTLQPWEQAQKEELDDIAVRILVAGKAGVGKSSLINKVFGVSAEQALTSESVERPGVHDINKELRWKTKPDLIMHDSGGFEAGKQDEYEAVEQFFKEKSKETNLQNRLHLIWYCIETDDPRPTVGTEHSFQLINQYMSNVPVILVATKADKFVGDRVNSQLNSLMADPNFDRHMVQQARQSAQAELKYKLRRWKVLLNSKGLDIADAYVPVSKDDTESIELLVRKTTESFKDERLRLAYVSAQVASIDEKVDLAIKEAMRIYKDMLTSSIVMAGVPTGSMTNRFGGTVELCRKMVKCFGMIQVDGKVVADLFKANLKDEASHSALTLLADGMAAGGLVATLGTGMPILVIPAVINIPITVPATARLMLMLACDLIIVFSRAYNESSVRYITQPRIKDLRSAVDDYQNYYRKVHDSVASLAPRRNLVGFFRTKLIEEKMIGIIKDFRHQWRLR
ncbi:hypothetical protein HJFPF1_05994 [Paramyrothecium foliicola]|nr:hypothetical protein HJFPF1_05994 [Paramyrothecium foliicola]